jgi:hypothetical protein
MAKGKHVLSLCGCAESFNRPNEIIGIYFVARLDRSVPGEDGKLRVVKIIDSPPITIIDGNRVIGWMC